MSKIRNVFLYAAALVGLILVLVGSGSLVNLGLKTYVFTKADYPCATVYPAREPDTTACLEQRESDKQRQAADSLAQIIIGAPVFLYFYSVTRKVNELEMGVKA